MASKEKKCHTIKEEKDADGITYMIRCENPDHTHHHLKKESILHARHQVKSDQKAVDSEVKEVMAKSNQAENSQKFKDLDPNEEVTPPEEDDGKLPDEIEKIQSKKQKTKSKASSKSSAKKPVQKKQAVKKQEPAKQQKDSHALSEEHEDSKPKN